MLAKTTPLGQGGGGVTQLSPAPEWQLWLELGKWSDSFSDTAAISLRSQATHVDIRQVQQSGVYARVGNTAPQTRGHGRLMEVNFRILQKTLSCQMTLGDAVIARTPSCSHNSSARGHAIHPNKETMYQFL